MALDTLDPTVTSGVRPREECADSSTRLVKLSAELERANAQIAELHSTVRDLNATLDRRVEERTRELRETLNELETFAYTVAHDLRAPLRAMHGFSQILLGQYGEVLDATGQELLGRIASAGERMDVLIKDLLAYSRLSREKISLGMVDLQVVLEDVLEQASRDIAAAEARVVVHRPLPKVWGHATSLAQALTNLVVNAVKFVPPGGPSHVEISAEVRGPMVRIWVEDEGIGIAPEHASRLFHLFERLHSNNEYPGTGIGLAMVRRALERMGGQAGFESELGRGSRFWVELLKEPPAWEGPARFGGAPP